MIQPSAGPCTQTVSGIALVAASKNSCQLAVPPQSLTHVPRARGMGMWGHQRGRQPRAACVCHQSVELIATAVRENQGPFDFCGIVVVIAIIGLEVVHKLMSNFIFI